MVFTGQKSSAILNFGKKLINCLWKMNSENDDGDGLDTLYESHQATSLVRLSPGIRKANEKGGDPGTPGGGTCRLTPARWDTAGKNLRCWLRIEDVGVRR